MKSLIRKLKKTNLSVRLVYYFVAILFLVSYVILIRSLLLLNSIETLIRIVVIISVGVLFLYYWFIDLLLLITKHHKTVMVYSVIAMLISCVSIVGSLYINKAYSLLDSMSVAQNDLSEYTTKLVGLKDTVLVNNSNFEVGIINNETDVEGNILAYELIKKEGLDDIKVNKFDTYFEMLEKLYNGTLDGIFLGDAYAETYGIYEQYAKIEEETKVLAKFTKKMKPVEKVEMSNTNVTEPFTVLLIGVDSDRTTLNFNSGFNSDTLMLITFNPKTLSATVLSVPRDTYVPICNKGFSSKINSASAYGGNCVVKTIENLVDLKVDFYAMINFQGVVDLVDALGGVTVNVEKPDSNKYGGRVCEQNSKRQFGENLVCMDVGVQRLNGEQALAYSRCRHLYAISDFARIQHQQDVVEAMANEMKNMKSVNDFYGILESISKNLATNMSTSSMMNLYNVFKSALIDSKDVSMINIQKTYLTGYNLNVIVPNISRDFPVYTYQYYESSLNDIRDALKVTLELKKPTLIKKFDFNANTNYTIKVIGKSYNTSSKNSALSSFIGKTKEETKKWCDEHESITCTFKEVDEENEKYNKSYDEGYVVDQSVQSGTMVSSIKDITFYVNAKDKKKSTTSSKTSTTSKTTGSTGKSEEETTEATTEATTKPAEEEPIQSE